MCRDQVIETARLKIRNFRLSDADDFANMNADPRVMKYFPATMKKTQSDAFLKRNIGLRENGEFSLFALEMRDSGEFIGFTGLSSPPYETAFTPCIEIGWRLVASAWGKGLAREAAFACMEFGFEQAGLHEIVSFTTVTNSPSRNLMKRLGMVRDPDEDFNHPKLDADHPLSRHVLYRMTKERWLAS